MIDSPEIMQILHTFKIADFAKSLYDCRYSDFFQSLAKVEGLMAESMYLYRHQRFYIREMRIKAYAQMLESYQRVELGRMAFLFGVSEDFIDRYFLIQ